MANGHNRRSRLQRVSSLELPPSLLERAFDRVWQGSVMLRVMFCLLAAVIMLVIVGGWKPPFGYRVRYVPERNIVTRVDFTTPDKSATEDARKEAMRQVPPVFTNRATPLVELRGVLKSELSTIAAAENLEKVDKTVWKKFEPEPPKDDAKQPSASDLEDDFQEFKLALSGEKKLQAIDSAVALAFAEAEQKGVLGDGEQKKLDGKLATRKDQIQVKSDQYTPAIPISDVLIKLVKERVSNNIKENREINAFLTTRLIHRLVPNIVGTLAYDDVATTKEQTNASTNVEEVKIVYKAHEKTLVIGGDPIDSNEIELLRREYDEYVSHLPKREILFRILSNLGMFIALFTLSGIYTYYREPTLISDFRRFMTLLVIAVAAVGVSHLVSSVEMCAEMVPLLFFGMMVGIAYHQELALLLTAELALIVCFTLGQGLDEYVMILSAAATSILLLGRIRTRSKLIYVGLLSCIVAFLTTIGVGVLASQPLGIEFIRNALINGVWALVACFIVSGLLPAIEKIFGVLTDLSLLEYGDPAHSLLQQLVQRAPGTYNHSINVASLAEAAAEAIGARGLLVRVGAYFHDIGKMLKPQYFVENQGREGNKHESLNPAMSTLVIIAHIKDGADLARQHHLPQPLIDFIQQHHGTTLVEYFFARARGESENNPDGPEVDESSFRYPGPKPQTREIGVLMLADAAESASRALVDPTPGRIEGLVHELAMKRLLDGQFDECGLTLSELAIIEESLVKSLTAVYHGRVKYPDQKTT